MNNILPASEYCETVFDGTHDTPKPVEKGKPLVTSKHIIGRRLDMSSAYQISTDDYNSIQKRSKVSQWDVLFTMIGTVGEVYIEKNTEIPYAIKNIGVFSCKDEIKAKWLYYYLQSPSATTHIGRYLSGAVQKFLSLGDLRDFPVLDYDPDAEKVVKFLTKLDKKIEMNDKINADLEGMAKTLYDYWYVQFDFPDENGKPYKSSGGGMIYNKILKREIPDKWTVNPLFEAMDVQYGYPFKTKKFIDEPNETPVVRIRDILNCTISNYTTETVDRKYKIREGDLLIGMDGNFHMNFWSTEGAYLNQRCVRIREKSNFKISSIQAFYEMYPYIKAREKNVSRTTVGHLSDEDLKELYLLKPTSNSFFQPDEIFNSILSKMVSNKKENQYLRQLRDWLLPMLMNGQVKVT